MNGSWWSLFKWGQGPSLSCFYWIYQQHLPLWNMPSYWDVWRQKWGLASAFNWFQSFLMGRTDRIVIGDQLSSVCDLSCGIPQGSILSPPCYPMSLKSPGNKSFLDMESAVINVQLIPSSVFHYPNHLIYCSHPEPVPYCSGQISKGEKVKTVTRWR